MPDRKGRASHHVSADAVVGFTRCLRVNLHRRFIEILLKPREDTKMDTKQKRPVQVAAVSY
jgi:hypothetical protein